MTFQSHRTNNLVALKEQEALFRPSVLFCREFVVLDEHLDDANKDSLDIVLILQNSITDCFQRCPHGEDMNNINIVPRVSDLAQQHIVDAMNKLEIFGLYEHLSQDERHEVLVLAARESAEVAQVVNRALMEIFYEEFRNTKGDVQQFLAFLQESVPEAVIDKFVSVDGAELKPTITTRSIIHMFTVMFFAQDTEEVGMEMLVDGVDPTSGVIGYDIKHVVPRVIGTLADKILRKEIEPENASKYVEGVKEITESGKSREIVIQLAKEMKAEILQKPAPPRPLPKEVVRISDRIKKVPTYALRDTEGELFTDTDGNTIKVNQVRVITLEIPVLPLGVIVYGLNQIIRAISRFQNDWDSTMEARLMQQGEQYENA